MNDFISVYIGFNRLAFRVSLWWADFVQRRRPFIW